MTTTLSEGVKVPDVGSVNWAGDLEVNWNLLNGALANLSGNVKTDRDNIWTGEQSFTLPIVGSITGTASKAIADEDGTSIKTGYVNVAGNQTVSGDKTWSGVNYFNNENLYQIATNPRYAFKSSILEIGVQPSGHCTATVDWLDSNDAELGYSRFVEYNNSIQTYEVLLKNKAENGSLSPAGNDISASLQLALFKTGSSQLNLGVDTVVPTSNNSASLGSSSYQWSSVYAQTYYYNGTAWGLNQNNTWTGSNTFNSNIKEQLAYTIGETPATTTNKAIQFVSSSGEELINVTGAAYSTGANIVIISAGDRFTENRVKSPTGTIRQCTLQIGTRANGDRFLYTDGTWRNALIPYIEYGSVSSDSGLNLGTSTNKWKTFNGINPGALSLPDYNSTAKVNISGSIVPDQYGNIVYTPPINGWLYVCFNVSNATTSDSIFYIQAKDNNVANSSFVQTSWMPASSGTSSLAIFFPVVANKQFVMQINFSNYTIVKAHVIPCLGNV